MAITAIEGQSGAGMMYGLGLITPRPQRMSDQAKRLICLKNWVSALEAEPRASAWFETELMRSHERLREQAAHVIGWGC